jgi:uracil-DNA glycosylase family 4
MSLFPPSGNHADPDEIRGLSFSALHTHGCNLCPLKYQNGYRPKHAQIKAHGSEHPKVYMLGEAPGEDEANQGENFVGVAGNFLHRHIPYRWEKQLRWNNVVRTRPVKLNKTKLFYINATPTVAAIECCRPSVQQDIEQSRPEAIFGFGGIPLHWTIKQNSITKWNGRRVPVRIGSHTCWYFPLLHPSYILRLDNDNTREQHEAMSFVFTKDLDRAFAAVDQGLPTPRVHTRADAESGIDCLRNLEAVEAGLARLHSDKTIGLDLETNCLRPYSDGACILSVALSGASGTVSFPLYHREAEWTADERSRLEDLLVDFLQTCAGRKVQFSPFEMEWLGYFYGDQVIHRGRWGDAQAQAFILDQRQATLDLNFICINHFGIGIKQLTNIDREQLDATPLDTVLLYNGIDAKYHRLTHTAQSRLLDEHDSKETYEHHVGRLKAATLMQLRGIPIAPRTSEHLARKYEARLAEVRQQIDATPLAKRFKKNFGHDYRPSNNNDAKKAFRLIGEVLPNAREAEIEKIADPLAKLHIEWKESAKVLSTYINAYRIDHEESCVFPDRLLHPILNLSRTRTWRSSCEKPNVQNAPKHFGDALEVRGQVEAPPGYKMVSFDSGQIQARNVAMESLDEALVQSFWDRHDIHADWRDRIFQLHPEWADRNGGLKKVLADKKLMKWFRGRAKNEFVFASFFGAGGRKVATTLGIPEELGYQLHDEFRDAFPGVADWHAGLHQFYQENGYVTGHSGFRRYAPVAHTEVINTPIQSDEAIIIFDAMIRLCEMEEPRFYPFMMVHDDLNFIWPDREIEKNAEVVVDVMLSCPFPWTKVVPLSVEISVGQSWDKVEEITTYGPLESDTWTGRLR